MNEDYDVDDLVDVIEGSRIYIPAIYVVNKVCSCTPLLQLECVITYVVHFFFLIFIIMFNPMPTSALLGFRNLEA